MTVQVIKHESNCAVSKQQAYFVYQKAQKKYQVTPEQERRLDIISRMLTRISMYKQYKSARKNFLSLKYCIPYRNMLGIVSYAKDVLEKNNIDATIVETDTGLVIRIAHQ